MESGRVVVKRFRQRSSGVASDLPVPEVALEPAQHSQPSALDQVPTLPFQALTQDSAEQSQPPALAQGAQALAPLESPLSLQSWSLVQPDAHPCSARQLFLTMTTSRQQPAYIARLLLVMLWSCRFLGAFSFAFIKP